MCAAGRHGRTPRRWNKTTIPDPAAAQRRDLIDRDFAIDPDHPRQLDRRWCGDITYIHTWQGWLYLATVIDLASRRVVGWATADHLRTDLVAEFRRICSHWLADLQTGWRQISQSGTWADTRIVLVNCAQQSGEPGSILRGEDRQRAGADHHRALGRLRHLGVQPPAGSLVCPQSAVEELHPREGGQRSVHQAWVATAGLSYEYTTTVLSPSTPHCRNTSCNSPASGTPPTEHAAHRTTPPQELPEHNTAQVLQNQDSRH